MLCSFVVVPIDERGDPWVRTDGWPVNSNSAQKKVLPIFSVRCALHLQLLMFPYMHYLYIWFLFLRGNSLTYFLDVRCLRDECVCDFRLWHARFSFLPTRGSMCCVNLLPFMALLLRNFGGPFYVKGNKRFFTQRGDNSLFPESKTACA